MPFDLTETEFKPLSGLPIEQIVDLAAELDVVAPEERLTVEEALRAVTIDAAYMLGLDHEVGSLRAGKKADFVVLDDDPFAVGADGLRDLDVLATVFEGKVFPVKP